MAKPGILTISDSPQCFDRPTTRQLYATVIACLVPAAAWGIFMFGWWAAVVLGLAVASAVLTEWLIVRILGRAWQFDGQVLLTGLLIGMVMPPTVPAFIPILASAFAVAVVKWPLGGTGSAWLHPAAAGWAFAFLSWPQQMSRFQLPIWFSGSGDPVAGSASVVRLWLESNPAGGLSPGDILVSQGYFHSAIDTRFSEIINSVVLAPLGAALPSGYVDAFLGIWPGSIGQVSAVLLLLGSVVLIGRRVIIWQLPAAFFGSFAVLSFCLGGLAFGTGLFSGDVLYFVLHGSFLLVLFFIATDLATSPLTVSGQTLSGLLLGLVCFLVAILGRGADAAIVSVLVVNALVGLIDRRTRVRRTRLRR